MAVIAPFRALRYNSLIVPDLGSVVAFPFDPFVGAGRARPSGRIPWVIDRLLKLGDRPGSAAVKQGQRLFDRWRADHVFIEEPRPALYVAHEEFSMNGVAQARTVLYAMVDTQPKMGPGAVMPHERTNPERQRRFAELLRAYQADISPMFSLYDDQDGGVRTLLARAKQREPEFGSFEYRHERLEGALRCRVVRVTDPDLLARLSKTFVQRPLFIADGHHRYGAALQLGARWVLMGLTAVQDPGLLVLPIHRLVHVPSARRKELWRRVRSEFRVDAVPANRSNAWFKEGGPARKGLEIWAVSGEGGSVLRLPDESGGGVGLLLTLQHVLEGERVSYAVKLNVVKREIGTGKGGVGFLVPALNIADILDVVKKRGVLPVKSTYFFPKLFSGLVMALTPLSRSPSS